MIGGRLKRARAAAGLSMKALGEQVGVSANMIKKYEHDDSMPTSPVLIRLARALGVRSEYFFRPVRVSLNRVEYRKRASTTKAELKRIEADVLDQAERWQELADLWPEFPVSGFSGVEGLPETITDYTELENVANHVRRSWKLGLNPLPDVIDVLESKGILVITTDVDVAGKFDGLQATVAGQPLIVVSSQWHGDRQRFTLAHEFGHLLLEGRLSPDLDEEKACNYFASAFLLPAESVREHIGESRHSIEVRELYMLKHEYGLSMQACLYRLKVLKIISDNLFDKLIKRFSAAGWRKQEPGEQVPQESTILFQQLVYRALAEGIVGESKAAELLKLPLMQFHQMRKLEAFDAVADQ